MNDSKHKEPFPSTSIIYPINNPAIMPLQNSISSFLKFALSLLRRLVVDLELAQPLLTILRANLLRITGYAAGILNLDILFCITTVLATTIIYEALRKLLTVIQLLWRSITAVLYLARLASGALRRLPVSIELVVHSCGKLSGTLITATLLRLHQPYALARRWMESTRPISRAWEALESERDSTGPAITPSRNKGPGSPMAMIQQASTLDNTTTEDEDGSHIILLAKGPPRNKQALARINDLLAEVDALRVDIANRRT
jgi:hypothetical protein